MRIFFHVLLILSGLILITEWATAETRQSASAVPPLEELDFSPPPVPEFMLRKQTKPLTLEEMKLQAEEAARRARRDKVNPVPTPTQQ